MFAHRKLTHMPEALKEMSSSCKPEELHAHTFSIVIQAMILNDDKVTYTRIYLIQGWHTKQVPTHTHKLILSGSIGACPDMLGDEKVVG